MCAQVTGSGGEAVELQVDCSQVTGEIRPLHGGNCGPLQYGELVDLTAYHRELAIPYARLHDCHWPNPDVVDFHAVFPNPDADPERALAAEKKRLALVDAEISQLREESLALSRRMGPLAHRAIAIDAEIRRLEELIKKKGKP